MNPALYEAHHSFVWERGRELVPMLDAQPGWRVLDVGCGPGQLTAEIARSGAVVLGVDKSPGMIARARANFPELEFREADVTALEFDGEFDAVFSNATLHWVREARAAARSMARALKPVGRFVAELGGRGNIRRLLEALYGALESMGVEKPGDLNPWYYPSVGEYAGVLEEQGLEVTWAALFDRPTPLEGGLAAWLETFAGRFLDTVKEAERAELTRRVEERAAPWLLRNGIWTADYRRLRVVAVKGWAPEGSHNGDGST